MPAQIFHIRTIFGEKDYVIKIYPSVIKNVMKIPEQVSERALESAIANFFHTYPERLRNKYVRKVSII